MRNINFKKEREIIKEECKYLGDVLIPELTETYKLSNANNHRKPNTDKIIEDVFSKNKTIKKNVELHYWIENDKIFYDIKEWKLMGNNLIDFFIGSCVRLKRNKILELSINTIPIPYEIIVKYFKELIYKYPREFMNEVILLPYFLVEIDIQSCIEVLIQSNYYKNNTELSSEYTNYLNDSFLKIVDNAFLHFACALADNHFLKIEKILCKDLYNSALNNYMFYTDMISFWLEEILEYKIMILDYLENNNNNNNIHISERKNVDLVINENLMFITGKNKR